MLPVGQPSKVCTSARFCQIGVNGISEATVHDIGAGVGVLTPEKVGVGPNVPMGRVGWLRMTTVGRGSVGAGVDDGSLMPVGLGMGVGESSTVASALAGIWNRSATTNGFSSAVRARQPVRAASARQIRNGR